MLRALNLARSNHAVNDFYALFLHFFASLDRKDSSAYTAYDVERYIQALNVAETTRAEWQAFWKLIITTRFGPPHEYDVTTLYEQAKQWIHIFGKLQ